MKNDRKHSSQRRNDDVIKSFENCSPDEKLRQQFAARETEFPLSFPLPNYLNKSKSTTRVLVVKWLSH